jgi:pimeloyl-ACP methyl ester carboxylesterase
MSRWIPVLLAITLAAVPTFARAQAEKPVSIVLVHGAFVDASGWKPVYDILARDGYEVLMVQNPTVTLEGDVVTTERVIAAAKHPVVLVGHSYGGGVITQAGDNPKVASLVYLAAFAPDVGETIIGLAEQPAPGEEKAPLVGPTDGYLLVDQAKFPAHFAAGADPALTKFMAVSQVPWGVEAVHFKFTKAAWKVKPTSFLVTTQDLMIPPSQQRAMAKRTGGRVQEIASSHAVMLVHPQEVASFIKSAATVNK